MSDSQLTFSDTIQQLTEYGNLHFMYASFKNKEALIVYKDFDANQSSLLLRIHSSCVFSETFHAIVCDCAAQLATALKLIASENGLVIYVYDEGRGAGLLNKVQAIRLQQDESIDTAQAFKRLGLNADERSFDIAIEIIKKLVAPETEIELLTNSPYKTKKLTENGVKVTKVRPLIEISNDMVRQYLLEKKAALGHVIEIDE